MVGVTTYTVDLSPALVGLDSDGSLDEHKDADGNSLQRQYFGVNIVTNTGARKMTGVVKDGETFDDSIETVSDYPGISTPAPIPL